MRTLRCAPLRLDHPHFLAIWVRHVYPILGIRQSSQLSIDPLEEITTLFGRKPLRLSSKSAKIRQLALGGSGPGETDEDLAIALAGVGREDRASFAAALKALPTRGIETYREDRARRVLRALAGGSPVEPVAEENRDLYAAEQSLEEMPPLEGLNFLIERQPALADLVGDLATHTNDRQVPHSKIERVVWDRTLIERLEECVGPRAGAVDPLASSPVALSVAIRGCHKMLGVQIP